MKSAALYRTGIFISCVLAFFSVLVVIYVSIPYAIVAWDEASNMVWGYKVYKAMHAGNWRLFFELSKSQLYYPPLHSWFIGALSLISGFSIALIRVVNLLWLLLIAPLIFYVGYSFRKGRSGFWTGLISVVLFLTSPLTLALSGIALKEIMGTALTLIAFIAYTRMEEKNKVWYAIVAGFLMLCLFYFKYNYALFLCAGLGIMEMVNFAFRCTKNYRQLAVFWTISVVGMGAWLLLHGQQLITVFVHGQTPQTIGIGTWMDKMLFFPKSIVFVYAPNAGIGLFIICAFFYSLIWIKNKSVRALWVIVFVYFCILGVYVDNLHERYVFPIVPLLYILAGYTGVHFGAKLYKAYALYIYLFACLTIFMGIRYAVLMPVKLYAVGAHALRSPIFNQFDYKDTIFDFNLHHWPVAVPRTGDQSPSDVVAHVFGVIGPKGKFRVVGNINELSPKFWELSALITNRSVLSGKTPGEYLVYVEVVPGSRFYTRDYLLFNSKSTEPIKDIIVSPEYAVVDKKSFSDIGINVIIYQADGARNATE